MAMHLFIDTNTYLSFYHYTKDDTAAIDKLLDAATAKKITLHLPVQVYEEWERNRDTRLANAAKDFKRNSFVAEIPRHMQGLSKAAEYAQAISVANKAREHLIAEANAKARTYSLDVDVMLSFLFAASLQYPHDDAIFARAKIRAERGNPPGKGGSFGDQYNWEMLLEKVPSEDLYIVTKDGDYVSTLDGKDESGMAYPNSFLKAEWSKRKINKNLYVFDSIKSVLDHYEKIVAVSAAPREAAGGDIPVENKIGAPIEAAAQADVTENEKSPVGPEDGITEDGLNPDDRATKLEAINELLSSASFVDTHTSIAKLTQFLEHFTTVEAVTLFHAAISNTQISWIISDSDVNAFYLKLVSQHFAFLDDDTLEQMIELLGIGLAPDDEGREAK